MKYYNAIESLNFHSEHTLLYTFQYKEAIAKMITTMSGNVAGGHVMTTNFELGVTAPINNEINKKYVRFYTDEDNHLDYQEVQDLKFIYPDSEDCFFMAIEDCTDCLVGINIIDYKSNED